MRDRATRVAHLVDRPGHCHEIRGHLGVHGLVAEPRVTGQHHERRVAAVGLVDHANRVAEADAGVELDDRRSLRGSGVPVGHRYRDRLLEGQDVGQLRVVAQGVKEALLGRARVPEHVLNAIGEQLFEDRKAPCAVSHRVCPSSSLDWGLPPVAREPVVENLHELLAAQVGIGG